MSLALVAIVTLTAGPALAAAAQAGEAPASGKVKPACPADVTARDFRIPLNNTGIADFNLVNPRRPAWLVDSAKSLASLKRGDYRACLAEVSVQFVNKTATRSFLVTLPFTLKSPAQLRQEIDDELRKVLPVVDSLARLDPPRRPPAALSPAAELTRAILQQLDGLAAVRLDTITPLRQALKSVRAEVVKKLTAMGHKNTLLAREADRLDTVVTAGLGDLRQYFSLPDPDQQCTEPNAIGRLTCSLQISVPVGAEPTLSPSQWKAIYTSAPSLIKFVVSFFDDQATPANATGYLRTSPTVDEETSKTSWSVVGSLAYTRDPETGRTDASGSRVRFTPDDAYRGGERRRFPASGRVSLNQTLGNRATANLDLTFKAGDFGGEASTSDLKATKYDVTLFGVRGFSTRAGRYTMATPSDGLAINESGEGIELVFPGLGGVSLGHIVKRESLSGKADADDRDSQVTLLQARNLPVPEKLGITGASLTVLYGEENREDRDPYDYLTVGGELQFGSSQGLTARGIDLTEPDSGTRKNGEERWQINAFSGSLAHYRSERDAKTGESSIVPTPAAPCSAQTPCRVEDAEGEVTLATLTWSRTLVGRKTPKIEREEPDPLEFYRTKPLRTFQLRLGQGTGDDPNTPLDEGYLGETARFAPDKIFLRAFAADLDPLEGSPIGAGLSNKRYLELTYTDQTWSAFQRFSWWLTGNNCADVRAIKEARKKDPFSNKLDPIVSQATIVKVHLYRFEDAVRGSRDAGLEVGVDFQIEVPKGIKSTLGAGWFFPGKALEPFFAEDPFIISFSTSLTLK